MILLTIFNIILFKNIHKELTMAMSGDVLLWMIVEVCELIALKAKTSIL